MHFPRAIGLLCLAAISSRAQESSSTTSESSSRTTTAESNDGFSFTNSYSVITGTVLTSAFTGSDYVYLSPTGQSTVRTLTETITASNGSVETITTTSSASHNSQITVSTSSVSLINIGGTPNNATATSSNGTASSTTSSARPTNTVPCNGYPEFCNRKYSNITMIATHNANFHMRNNAASNQLYPIDVQMNDGVRMLTGEIQYVNDTLYSCHTSCELLNAGTLEQELVTLREWIQAHPYDVVTVLLVNSNFVNVENFTAPITNAGLLPYVYTPSYIPQYRDQWPTLGEMILKNQRVVFFMDYQANQAAVPYILDQYTHVWETPFSPQDPAFPCTIQRPPNLNETVARDQFMYLANHNLNTAIDLSSLGITTAEELLVPNTAQINNTNGQLNQYGQLEATRLNCTADWGRPPNFLVVDYYNYGYPKQGSVFHVAASANGVTYNQACCGTTSAAATDRASYAGLFVALIAVVLFAW